MKCLLPWGGLLAFSLFAQTPPVITIEHQYALSQLNVAMLRLQIEQREADEHAKEATRLKGEVEATRAQVVALLTKDCGEKFVPQIEPGKDSAVCVVKPATAPADPHAPPQNAPEPTRTAKPTPPTAPKP